MKLGDFVTANMTKEDAAIHGFTPVQGIYAADYPDGSFRVEGVSGIDYHCKGHTTVVPPENLWGDAAHFAATRRRQLRPFEDMSEEEQQ